ncbi:MAG: HAMP domain-containing sensor histidine kinase [Dehalococcoidia bacterium]|nr:HAMP domain-containing sensor histidine kinase [Dehalococcoidia bacterium]
MTTEVNRDLVERVKELNCLYGISRLVEAKESSLEKIIQGVVELIPPAWQYPEVTCARITYKKREYKTLNFRATPWRQTEAIKVDGKRCGTLEVCYLEPRPVCDEGPFLAEERNLIHAIAERLGHIIEREIAEERAESLYRQEKELRERLQMEMQGRVDFTRKMIHELKTPLTSLMATSQLLMDETRDTRLGKLAGYVWEGACSLNSRIEELHDVIRGEIGKLELKPKPVNLGSLLRAVADEMAALSRQHGMSIDVEIEEPLPQVQADPERVRQIMFNLINNAFKYARDGKKIRIRATRTLNSVQVEVRDYGPGIAPERQARLFDPGYQLSRHESQSGGLGIGLALCKILVELSGGRIWLKSRPGKGCSFFFTLPVVK